MRTGLVSFGQGLYFASGAYAAGVEGPRPSISATRSHGAPGGPGGRPGRRRAGHPARSLPGHLLRHAVARLLHDPLRAAREVLRARLDRRLQRGRRTVFSFPIGSGLGRYGVYALAALCAFVSAVGLDRYLESYLGRLAPAVRDNELRVEYMGASVATWSTSTWLSPPAWPGWGAPSRRWRWAHRPGDGLLDHLRRVRLRGHPLRDHQRGRALRRRAAPRAAAELRLRARPQHLAAGHGRRDAGGAPVLPRGSGQSSAGGGGQRHDADPGVHRADQDLRRGDRGRGSPSPSRRTRWWAHRRRRGGKPSFLSGDRVPEPTAAPTGSRTGITRLPWRCITRLGIVLLLQHPQFRRRRRRNLLVGLGIVRLGRRPRGSHAACPAGRRSPTRRWKCFTCAKPRRAARGAPGRSGSCSTSPWHWAVKPLILLLDRAMMVLRPTRSLLWTVLGRDPGEKATRSSSSTTWTLCAADRAYLAFYYGKVIADGIWAVLSNRRCAAAAGEPRDEEKPSRRRSSPRTLHQVRRILRGAGHARAGQLIGLHRRERSRKDLCLMRAIMALSPADGGHHHLRGRLCRGSLVPACRGGMGQMPEDLCIIGSSPSRKNVSLPAWAAGNAHPAERLRRIYEMIPEVGQLKDRKGLQLSGGPAEARRAGARPDERHQAPAPRRALRGGGAGPGEAPGRGGGHAPDRGALGDPLRVRPLPVRGD